jgi:hypothetical protein
MELAPASLSVVSFYSTPGEADRASLRLYNALPPGRSAFDPAVTNW